MRFILFLSAAIALALMSVVMVPNPRPGLAQQPQGNPTRTPARSPTVVEAGPEVTSLPRVQQDDDGPDRTELILWTLAAAGGAALLALIGYAVRKRVGYFPHRPPPRDGSAPQDHH